MLVALFSSSRMRSIGGLVGNTTKKDKQTVPRQEAEVPGSKSSELSVTIEGAVSGLLEVFIRYIRTVFLIIFRPNKTATHLASEYERNQNRLSSPKTFLLISSFLSSALLSFAYKILLETSLEYEEIRRLALAALTQGVQVTTSLAAILTATFPAIVAVAAAAFLICWYIALEKRHLPILTGIAYIAIAFAGLLFSLCTVIFVSILPAAIAEVIGTVFGGESKGKTLAFEILFWILVCVAAASIFVYPTVLIGRAAEYLQPRHLFRVLTVKKQRLSLPSWRLIALPIVLIFGVLAFLSGLASPTVVAYLLNEESRNVGRNDLDIVVVKDFTKRTASGTDLLSYVAIKNKSADKLIFLKDSVTLELDVEQRDLVSSYSFLGTGAGKLTVVYGNESGPIRLISPGDVQLIELRTEIPSVTCNVPEHEILSGEAVYYRIVVGDAYPEYKLFGKKESSYSTSTPRKSNDKFLCFHQNVNGKESKTSR